MTPHDELMALAGKAAAIAAKLPTLDTLEAVDDDARSGRRPCPITLTISEVRDLRALLDSNAFRAMVRDAGLGRYVAQQMIERGPIKTVSGQDVYCVMLPAVPRDAGADAAIDAAASGAGEG